MLHNKQDLTIAEMNESTAKHIYSYSAFTDQLTKTLLATGKKCSFRVLSYRFLKASRLTECSDGKIRITGGGGATPLREAAAIDTTREFAVTFLPQMKYSRRAHGALCYAGFVYVVGGYNDNAGKTLHQCERYNFKSNEWEALGSLTFECQDMRLFMSTPSQCLYSLGGSCNQKDLDVIQRL
mmetsp:Transcript_1551/g.3315  ORF Transcript_1551/g.3315 Transcript_1551/m.3315 type:complete len:182 (-) Transcript_1551:789-1334(-)